MYSIFEKLNKIDDKRSLNEDMNTGKIVRLEVQYEPYSRYGGAGGLTVGRVSGKDELTALTKLVGRLNMYLDADTIVEENLTVPEILERLEEQNGDGCDFIVYIKNLSTGETLLDSGDYVDYEEWDDDSDLEDVDDYELDEGFIADIKKNIKDKKNQKIADIIASATAKTSYRETREGATNPVAVYIASNDLDSAKEWAKDILELDKKLKATFSDLDHWEMSNKYVAQGKTAPADYGMEDTGILVCMKDNSCKFVPFTINPDNPDAGMDYRLDKAVDATQPSKKVNEKLSRKTKRVR